MSVADFDAYGVPTYYMTVPIAEPAGGGNVRVWNCALKHGILVPQCEMIIPATDLLVASHIIREAALKELQKEREMVSH